MRGSGTPEIERALTAIRERRHVAISLPHWGVAPQLIEGTDLILTVSSRGLLNIDHRASGRRCRRRFIFRRSPLSWRGTCGGVGIRGCSG